MNTDPTIFITTQFEGFHCWPGAPDEVSFLRERHRHMFHVRVDIPVTHTDRDVEFILFKRDVETYLQSSYPTGDLDSMSCEEIAGWLGDWVVWAYEVAWVRVEVSEDGENGASRTIVADDD